ncbi:helix-turn-helix transcriptional regulator [Pseudomonas capeferrum]|uniref:helix-turn-helix domain-containing protein n=1 Tax=Pseudomonas capeferrum TaxID=1495066 RepID=UPI0015E3162B|nr:helix-turn-helix transcriptional regulator [Pseudomonas capeferrum]MBA1205278.1 helix-turn-helix transcriptional regulator [Pseudomonas capeferrum]
MDIQVISRDGEPEYAVVPWEHYQALLKAAGHSITSSVQPVPQSSDNSTGQGARVGLPSLGELPALRQAKGVTPEQLARSVGISPAYLAMIESGERQPDAAIRRSLAWEVGVDGWSDPS